MFDMLSGVPLFSQGADKAYNALKSINEDDSGLRKFAERVGRALTVFEAGFYDESKPVGSFLFRGSPAAPFRLIAEALGREWFGGMPFDGSPPYIFVDCAAFSASYPGVLARLTGPLPQDSLGRQGTPVFASLYRPHFYVRGGDKLAKLWSWREWFLRDCKEDIQGLKNKPHFYAEIDNICSREEENHYQRLEAEEPFRGLVLFGNADRAGSELAELIRQIIRQGKVAVLPGSMVNFSRSILLLGVHTDVSLGPLGLPTKDEAMKIRKSYRGEAYKRARREMLGQYPLMGFVQDIGENVFLVDNRNLSSQRFQLIKELEGLSQTLYSLGLRFECSAKLIDFVCRDSFDAVLAAYTDTRLHNSLRRYVFYPLARLALSGALNEGDSLYIDLRDQDGSAETLVRKTRQGEGAVITKKDFDSIALANNAGARAVKSMADIEGDKWLLRVHERAEAALKRIAGLP